MAGTVDFTLKLRAFLIEGLKHEHFLFRILGSYTIEQSEKTEHVKGLFINTMWVCQHEDLEADVIVMCSDGTLKNLGPKGTTHSVLETAPIHYRCGEKPSPFTKPANIVPGPGTKQ